MMASVDLAETEAIMATHHESLAAVIMEPFQRLVVPDRAFLAGVRELTRRFGVPLIFDEIVTGFRFAYGGAQEYYGVVPDLAALGKIIGGGFPLAAVVGREEIMRHLAPALEETGDFVQQAGTSTAIRWGRRPGSPPSPSCASRARTLGPSRRATG